MVGVTVQTEQVPRPNAPRLPSAEDSLALRIRYERMRRNWSADELARRMTEAGCPLNQSAIWRIENATPRRKISLDEALGFAKVFGLDLDDLIGTSMEDVVGGQILSLVSKMRETSEELRSLRRQLVLAIAADTKAHLPDEMTDQQLAGAQEAAAELVRKLVREFPWIEEPG